jgi:phosphatidylinositol-3-phosphatase
MNRLRTVLAGLLATSVVSTAIAAEGPVPTGIPHLDHAFVIVMENHSYQQVINNPAMPFINDLITKRKANLATNYFAVGHPSSTNYLEIVGGSNFGVRSDNSPDWHNHTCQPNLQTGIPNADDAGGNAPVPVDTNNVCPIAGVGTDAATEAVDSWNEVNPPVFNFLANIDGVKSVPAAANTVGKTIGDQLVRAGLSWKSYQQNLPLSGADGIDSSNGTASNLTTFNAGAPLSPTNFPPLTSSSVVAAYAVKHNPFAYFQSVQEGTNPDNSLRNMVGFEGANGLFADLANGHVPSLSFIAPDQCNDQHGRGNGDAFCQFDPGTAAFHGNTDGTQVGLNPGLSAQADVTINKIVSSIKASPVWHEGYNAIVIVWDENDYSGLATAPQANTVFPTQNQNAVVLTVETNGKYNESGAHGGESGARSGESGVHSGTFYTSFSLLKSLEAGFRVQCLNHACDKDVNVMSDLFGAGH